ncbi:ATP-binding response regulator [Oceanospirillum sediminis]|uniref:histidine kinase n=1 Tax=Oceanospirillum sediminis TaxID=2760088 RepID=A0A839IR93_9GAMM|nr:ATP-binding protein [Oceanospirillum sediminis]MBB1487441.1 response regulator [Oceanospirillum sediminis]
MSNQNQAILFEMAVLMSSETSEASLIRTMLQGLIKHTGMYGGLFLTQIRSSEKETTFRVTHSAVNNRFQATPETLYRVKALPSKEQRTTDNSLVSSISPLLTCYQHTLFLPVGTTDAFLLLAEPDWQAVLPDHFFSPVLEHFAVPLQSCRDRERQKHQLQIEIQKRKDIEKRLNLVLDYIPAGVYWQNSQSEIQGVNQWLENDLGNGIQPAGETFDLRKVLSPDSIQQLQNNDDEVLLQGKEIYNQNYYLQRSDASFLWAEINKIPIRDDEGKITGLLGTYRDITGRKLMMEELLHAKESAEQANRAKSSFLASMSHELRTPLNAILGYTQLMEMDEDDLSEEHIISLSEIRTASNHLLQLIDEILDLSKIEAGRIDLSIQDIQPVPMIQEVLALTRPMAESHNITLTSHIESSFRHRIHGDAKRIRQILLNLVSNAIKYNKSHGEVSVTLHTRTDACCISIKDTGIGMSDEQVQRLFQPFERLGMESSTRQGTGIGLVICQKLAEAMQGRIEVTSAAGEGSTFSLVMPAITGETTLSPSDDSTQNNEQILIEAKTRTLYVEDNAANRLLVEKIFSKRPDDSLITVGTPEAGLKVLAEQAFDLILLDINLPGMTGFELLSEIHAHDLSHSATIVAISANAMPSDIDKGISAGFSAYLTKPLNIPEFNRQLNQWLSTEL